MQTKLTLRLDDRLISGAKEYAKGAGKSLSQIVADYFAAIVSPVPTPAPFKATLAVSQLRGILKDRGVGDERDYREYLEKKHL